MRSALCLQGIQVTLGVQPVLPLLVQDAQQALTPVTEAAGSLEPGAAQIGTDEVSHPATLTPRSDDPPHAGLAG